MQIDFLEAANGAALCKSHEADQHGNITTHPYPLVKKFNSYREEVNNITEFYNALTTHAARGNCALKGLLTETLESSDRKGKTNSVQPTQWVCLDLDFDTGFSSIQDFVDQLGPEFQDVSYIFQHSNSAGIKGKAGIRGHIFFFLAQPTAPGLLKEWLKEFNFKNPTLNNTLALAKNGHSLIWPLDVSTCQNDKLIYIAPPTLINIAPPIPKYFDLIVRKHDCVNLIPTPDPAKNKTEINDKVDEMRNQLGFKKKKARYKTHGSEDILVNPDPMIIAETRPDGEYTRVNLVGDNPSWGHYFKNDDPEILYNFKGFPLVRIRDIDRNFYKGLAQTKAANTRTFVPVIFRDFESDCYYNGLYNAPENTINIRKTNSAQKLEHFLAQYDIPMPDYVPDWDYKFDPTTLDVIDFDKKWANKFSPTPYLRANIKDQNIPVPATIDRIIRSVTTDQEAYDYFMNWLAYIFQTRKKTGTAWLFSGVPGIGKGLLISRIIQPIFGEQYVTRITTENLDDLFNAQFEEAIFLFIDEFNLKDSKQADKVANKLKNIITENRISIRKMRSNAIEVDSFLNVIMATNNTASMPITDADRRLNVSPPQETRLLITELELQTIESELENFSIFLNSYQVDEQKVHYNLENEARKALIDRSRTSVDVFFKALTDQNLAFFIEFLPNSENTIPSPRGMEYTQIIKSWASGEIDFIPRDELRSVYSYLQNKEQSTNVFSRMCNHYGLEMKVRRIDGKNTRGFEVDFNFNGSDPANLLPPDKETSNVIKLPHK